MDFDLSEEQQLIKESVGRLLADRYDFESRRRYAALPQGWSPELWRHYAELGLLGLPFPEALGGSAGGPVEIMIMAEAFGRHLVLEPWLATVILGGGLVRAAGSAAQQADLVPRIADGSLRLAFAHAEPGSRHDLSAVAATARWGDGGWRLDGTKTLALHGDAADRLLVSARAEGGIGLFQVDARAPGLTRRAYPTQDGLRAADLTLAAVPAEPLGEPGQGLPAIERVAEQAIAALAAETIGVMSAMLDATTEYLKTRRQFGRAIGELQALQHRAADMLVELEQARSMALLATMMVDDPDPAERRRALSAAKARIGRAARRLGQEAVQLHGGIGVTMEYSLGHYFKRLSMIELMFGDTDHHLARLARDGGLISAQREPA